MLTMLKLDQSPPEAAEAQPAGRDVGNLRESPAAG
jgi:hypothetical protein